MLVSFIKDTRLLKAYDTIKTSFWFAPCVTIIFTLLLCLSLLLIDTYSNLNQLSYLDFLYHADANVTRSLLSTIASSIMTVVSITFSITMVALTNASTQFGPRLIRNFMEDPSTQMVLGAFISLFVYCLILIRMTDSFAGGHYLPGLTLAGAMLLTLNGLLLLIYFIHHVAVSLQSDQIIDNVYNELQNRINLIFKEQKEEEKNASFWNEESTKHSSKSNALTSQSSGYVQAIDYVKICSIIKQQDHQIEVLVAPGDFVVNQMKVLVYTQEKIASEDEQCLINCISIGPKRTPIQDPEFAIHQLVEIALRALSPGINDPYSAIACVDKITAALCNLASKRFPQGMVCDEEKQPRVKYKTATFNGLANTAYNQIRQHAKDTLAVQLRLIEGLIRLAEQASQSAHWEFIEQQKSMLEQTLKEQSLMSQDRKETVERLNALEALLPKTQHKA